MKSVVYSMLALALTGLPAGADAKIIEASKHFAQLLSLALLCKIMLICNWHTKRDQNGICISFLQLSYMPNVKVHWNTFTNVHSV